MRILEQQVSDEERADAQAKRRWRETDVRAHGLAREADVHAVDRVDERQQCERQDQPAHELREERIRSHATPNTNLV